MPDFTFIEDSELREKVENVHKLEVDDLTVNFSNKLKSEVEDAVTGLKDKNSEILGEKKKLQEAIKAYEGLDAKAAREAMEFFEKNKDAEFLKDGTMDDLIEKKVSALKSDHEATMGELSSKLEETSTQAKSYKNLYESKVIEDALREAALAAKVRPEALTDIILRGRGIFSLDANKNVEARDAEGKLAKTGDDKVLTTKNWIEGLRETSPHYWPGSEGAGAFGGTPGSSDDLTARLKDAADKGNMKEYRRLRALKNKKSN
jgi:hypothetical protein